MPSLPAPLRTSRYPALITEYAYGVGKPNIAFWRLYPLPPVSCGLVPQPAMFAPMAPPLADPSTAEALTSRILGE